MYLEKSPVGRVRSGPPAAPEPLVEPLPDEAPALAELAVAAPDSPAELLAAELELVELLDDDEEDPPLELELPHPVTVTASAATAAIVAVHRRVLKAAIASPRVRRCGATLVGNRYAELACLPAR
ncbi:hypothetical protein GCM10011594_26650 [Nakamurella endophytica]|uniref:Uncharacterized protein n=1 Tax=Nakamurella endophytica TaxID=1748367 RepID=A0A917T0P9_9ACTN|nr:hypothetical protein GCM10011594_26650 [Nakamurella endophytica]